MRRRRRSGQSGHGTGDLWCRIPDHGARYPGRSFNLERRRSHGPDPELGRSRAATSEKLSRQKFAATELLGDLATCLHLAVLALNDLLRMESIVRSHRDLKTFAYRYC